MVKSRIFDRIVLAVDGSELSEKAVNKAFFISKATDIEIKAIHIINIPSTAMPPGGLTKYIAEMTKTMEKQGEKILNKIKEKGSQIGIDIETKLVEGTPDNEIIKFAHKNDLIVMGSKGHSTIERILIGSVSEKVLHHSEATVMIVR